MIRDVLFHDKSSKSHAMPHAEDLIGGSRPAEDGSISGNEKEFHDHTELAVPMKSR